MSASKAGRARLPAWRKASYCASGQCVEIAQRDGMVVLRDSAQAYGAMLHYATKDWEKFVRRVKAGQLDRPGS